MEAIVEYFSKDPLKILYLFGGAGGMWFWVEKWNNRIRFELLELSETYNSIDHKCDISIQIQCRNLSNVKTSLQPNIKVSGYFGASSITKISALITLNGSELSLEPHEVKSFDGKSRVQTSYCLPILKKYKITSTVGANKTVYYLGHSKGCNAAVWYKSLLLFKLFKRRPKMHNQALNRTP